MMPSSENRNMIKSQFIFYHLNQQKRLEGVDDSPLLRYITISFTRLSDLLFAILLTQLCSLSFCQMNYASDRITMLHGDIFLADIQKEENYRYYFERNGRLDILPNWWVKKIESDINQLPIQQTGLVLTPESRPELAGQKITITSATPAIASHLEMYPKYTHFWRQSGTYLRGYLANTTQTNYQQFSVRLVFYGTDQKIKNIQDVEIFRVFGNTMKPFIVSTRQVPWKKINRIDFQLTAFRKMK